MKAETGYHHYGPDYPHLVEQIELNQKYSYRVWQAFRAYTEYFIPLGLKPGDSILDLGCGLGALDHYLAKTGIKTTGVEINHHSLLAAQLVHPKPRLSFVAADVHELPFMPQSFDVVVSQDLFEHLEDEESAALALSQIDRICTGDLMLHKVTVMEDTDWIDGDQSHRLKMSIAWWASFFQKNGWKLQVSPTRKYPVWNRHKIGFHQMHGYFLLKRTSNG